MKVFELLFGKKNEYNLSFTLNRYVNVSDIIIGDEVWIRKNIKDDIITLANKNIGPSYTSLGKITNSKLAKQTLQNNYENYLSVVKGISGNYIKVTVKFFENNEEMILSDYQPQDYQQKSRERHERINKKIAEERRLEEEKRAKLQPEYDKVLNTHTKKLVGFEEKFELLKEPKNIKKLEKLLSAVEKEFENIEIKIEKREDVFYDRSDKWQESEKGKLYEDITNELNDLFFEIEEIKNAIKEILNSNR